MPTEPEESVTICTARRTLCGRQCGVSGGMTGGRWTEGKDKIISTSVSVLDAEVLLKGCENDGLMLLFCT